MVSLVVLFQVYASHFGVFANQRDFFHREATSRGIREEEKNQVLLGERKKL
jgi:hypothetical protein